MNKRPATVTLAAQLGGPDSSGATLRPHSELRRLLAMMCKGPYSPDIDEFALILRIDGEFQDFGFDGLKYLRRSRKSRYITIDIGIPRAKWDGRSEVEIRTHLAEMVRHALEACIKRLLKDRTFVNGDALMRDFERAATEYLKDSK